MPAKKKRITKKKEPINLSSDYDVAYDFSVKAYKFFKETE